MKQFVLFVAVAACLAAPVGVRGQVLPFTHYTPEREVQPLPSAEVHQVYQDRLSYIWMVIYSSGLVRYDGHRMEVYTTADGLRDLSLWAAIEDPVGRLWVASNAGLVASREALAAYEGGRRVRFAATIGDIPLLNVSVRQNVMALDRNGWLWVGTEDLGIVRYKVDERVVSRADTVRTAAGPGGANQSVRSMVVRNDGTVWVGIGGGGLLVFDATARRVDAISVEAGAPAQSIHTLYETPNGILWGGTREGLLWRLEERHGPRRLVHVPSDLSSNIVSLHVSLQGALWVASEGGGLLRLDPETATIQGRYHRENGLLSEIVHHVREDVEGNLWVSQSGGISKLRTNYRAFENFTAASYTGEQPSLPAPAVNAVLTGGTTDPCAVWAGTEGGIACIRSDGRSEHILDRAGLQGNWVNALVRDDRARIWIGTPQGVSALSFAAPLTGMQHSERFRVFGQDVQLGYFGGPSILSAATFPLAREPGSDVTVMSVWFAGYQGLYCMVEDAWYVFDEASGLPATVYHAVMQDTQGHVWVGTRDQGLYRSTRPLTGDVLRQPGRLPGRNAASAASIREAALFERVWPADANAPTHQVETLRWQDGAMWVGTPIGLFVLEGSPLQESSHLTEQQGLASNAIFSMSVSPATGTLWVGTNGGLVEIDPASRTVLRSVTRQDGLVDNEVWYYGSVQVDAEGTVYYGTAKGLARYRPHEERSNDIRPPLRIRTASYVEDDVGHNEVIVAYAALSFANERLNRYRTRLAGYDAEGQWSPVTSDARFRFTNLPAFVIPRRYTLEIQARNNDGLWTTAPATYAFQVNPPWWMRWWTLLLYLGLLAAGLLVLDRFQRRRLMERERVKRQMLELEQARQLQLSMLPAALPDHPAVDIAAFMQTATEVGGDYYDFDVAQDDTLTVAVGDATGHGVQAGTMVTATKAVFNVLIHETNLTHVMHEASVALKRLNLPRLFMAFALAKLHGRHLEIAGAGMPPALLYRSATATIEAIPLKGLPLGSITGIPYRSTEVELAPGDTIVFMTDGFPELFNEAGDMLGYDRIETIFREVAGRHPEAVIQHFKDVTASWRQQRPPDDDITFVVLRAKDPGGRAAA